jgi:hypothetical protein
MKYDDQKIYRTFEEFEREELRRADGYGALDEALVDAFAEELGTGTASRRAAAQDDDADQD